MTENEQIQVIDDLLIGFDELGFRPTIPLPDPEATAVRWRNKLVNALKGYRKVERGEWGFDGSGWTCSECGEYALCDKHGKQMLSNNCPHCGADMRGDGK